jgi:ABC-2 type transport system ATP-binding protein
MVGSADVSAEKPPLLILTQISRSYGPLQALKPVDLAVDSGQCVALLGVNGSGKSTLLRIAAGRDSPTTGQVRYGGSPLREDALAARTEIAMAGDASSTYPDLTVREHLLLVAIAHGAGSRADGLVDSALTECRLAAHGDALPGSLSSGQRQALQLAAVLVRPRRLLILDEPEQRLDPAARRWLAAVLAREKSQGAAVLLATHHVELAEAVADLAVVLLDGEVVGRGAAADVLGSLR